MMLAGFPCTSASRLNASANAVDNLSCVENGELATGSTFAALVDTLQHTSRGELKWVILENVTSLARTLKKKDASGRSNFDWVAHIVRKKLNMFVIAWHLDPLDFWWLPKPPTLVDVVLAARGPHHARRRSTLTRRQSHVSAHRLAADTHGGNPLCTRTMSSCKRTTWKSFIASTPVLQLWSLRGGTEEEAEAHRDFAHPRDVTEVH